MNLLDPRVRELGISVAILASSYVAARLVSALFGLLLARGGVEGRALGLNDRLVAALKRPLTYTLFLVGAYAAVHRSPLPALWSNRLDAALFVLSVAFVSAGAIKAYAILLGWYTTETRSGEGLSSEFAPLLSKLGTLAIVLIAVITVLQRMGVNVESLVVSLGVGSLAVGLAAQDTLANMFAGFTLMLDRPFKVGDRIKLASGEVGDVLNIGIRATRLKTTDDTLLVIPNSALTRDRLVNQSVPSPLLATQIDIAVPYGMDLARAKSILTEAALSCALVDDARPPLALVTAFGDFAVKLRVVFWTRSFKDQSLAVDQVFMAIHARFREAGIEIPFIVRKVLQEVSA